jgi:urease accessory protein
LRGASSLVFDHRGGHTVLVEAHVELPLQVQRPRIGPCGEAIVTLLTPGGCLLDGDQVALDVQVRRGAHAVLRQASATQLHGGGGRGIELNARIHVGAGARLSYLPYELIPFAGSTYRQALRVNLAEGASALLVEVVTPGRSWEHFGYHLLDLRTDVFLDEHRLLLDAQHIEPGRTRPELMLAGFTHFGTLLQFGPNVGADQARRLHDRLAASGVCGSASVLAAYGMGARALGYSADCLSAAFNEGR